jgi:signal peptide peptidase SppA
MNLLFRSILGKPWAIDPRFVEANASFISDFIQSGKLGSMPEMKFSDHFMIDRSGLRTNSSINNAPQGSIAVIELKGPLMKYDQECGPAGTASVASWIKQADSNPNIDGILLKTDSPGGTVDGTEELGRTIASTKKPIVAFIDGMAASAAYWAVSQANEIIASGKTSEAGSIGTMASWADLKPIMEKAGIKFHEVYATKSSDKNAAFRNAMGGDYTQLIAELDAVNDVFEAAVKRGRASIKEDVFSGKIYFSTEAKKLGLIDSIGTMDDAVKAISRLKNSRNMSKNKNATAYPTFAAVAGFTEGFEMTEEGIHINAETLQSVETALANGAQAQTDLTALQGSDQTKQINTLQEQVTTLTNDRNTLTAERDRLNARVAELEGKPANKGAKPEAGAEDTTPEKKDSPYVDDGSMAYLEARTRK